MCYFNEREKMVLVSHRITFKGILLALMLIIGVQAFCQTPFVCEGQFYITMTNNGNSRLLEVTIDPFTQQVNFLTIDPDLRVEINAIGYRNEENLIYGVDPNQFDFYRVDRFGNVETLRRLPLNNEYGYYAGDITPDGSTMILIGGINSGFRARDYDLVLVDLTDPAYGVTRMNISGETTRIYDIAFDPLTGLLYGFDSANDRLVLVDYQTATVSTPFGSTGAASNVGSMFFDAFGELYAYGGGDFQPQNTLFRVDKESGRFQRLTGGGNAEGTDACSCPYTIEMIKTVSPEVTYPCQEVIYTFGIANGSGRVQSGIDFFDDLPDGLEFVRIEENPFGGTLISQPGDNLLRIENLTIPLGVDSLKIVVYVSENTVGGVNKNQASLNDLPESLGDRRLSDYPRTLVEQDSTPLTVLAIPFDSLYIEDLVCLGENILLDVSEYGLEFLWENGSTSPQREITQGGSYSVRIAAGCDTGYVFYTYDESEISVSLQETEVEIELGDSLLITPTVFNTGDSTFFTWLDHEGNPIQCGDCTSASVVPLFSGTYTIVVSNEFGCTDEVSLRIIVKKERVIWVPNAFTPDGNGLNDRVYVFGKGFGFVEQFQIFDRWGELVFDASEGMVNETSLGWDGTFLNQPALPGVYVWKTHVRFLDRKVEVYSGSVTLLR